MKKQFKKLFVGLLSAIVLLTSLPYVGVTAADETSGTSSTDEFYVIVSLEGLTLGQGFYLEPTAYTLDEINTLIATEGYDACTEDTLTAGYAVLAMLLDKEYEYTMTGDWKSSAYLASIKGVDKGTIDIPAIITENGGPSNEENDGNDDDYLGEFDYSSMAGWMISINNHFAGVGMSQYNKAQAEAEESNFDSGSVIRLQFTLYGYGSDLGTSMMGSAYYTPADKSALYRKYTSLSESGFFTNHADAKTAALTVMEKLTATQTEVDAALTALTTAESEANKPATPTVTYKSALNATLAGLAATVTEPKFGTSGGEWTVLSLARGGYYEKDSDYFSDYYDRIVETVNTTAAAVNLNGALHATKSTENSRLILALSAIGRDATKVGKYNLVDAYDKNGIDWIKKQGINGPIFALLALDSHNYTLTDTTLRKACVDYILEKALSDGGWALTGTTADPDITSMALQALAPYTSDDTVKAACTKAFTALSNLQKTNGGFTSWGSENCESIAQVIVACTAHKIDPTTDTRFVKSGGNPIDALLRFYNDDTHNFSHVADGDANAIATDQACYALVAYDRLKNNKKTLYDMNDVTFATDGVSSDTIKAYLALPAKISGNAGTSLKASVNLTGYKNSENFKLMDCIVTVPSQLSVASVTAGAGISGGTLSYHLEESSGKLRIVYFDAQEGKSIQISGSEPNELFSISFTLKGACNGNLNLAVSGMSFKKSSDSTQDASMRVVDTATAYGSVTCTVDSLSFSAVRLYTGDGVDLIPTGKSAVAVSVANLSKVGALTYKNGNTEIEFLYNAAVSTKIGVPCYVAMVDSTIEIENFADKSKYTVSTDATAKTVVFGDINDDGLVNAQDALAAVDLWLRKTEAANDKALLSANVNGDSRINTFDALGIVEAFVNGTDYAVVTKAAVLGGTAKQTA